VWYQDAKACLARGENAQAAICFHAAAKRFAHVPGEETWAAGLHRYAGDAHAQANDRVAAVVEFITASKLDLAYALALTARVPPQPSDAAAALDAVTRAACDLAVAAAFYRAMELPKLALVVGAVAASAFVDLGLCPQAAALLDEISDIWIDIARVQCQANQLMLAKAAVEQAVGASHSAALAHWATHNYLAAGRTLVKVCDFDTAAKLFTMGGDHGSAGLCYLSIGQRCEAAVAAHRDAGQPEQAGAEAQRALAFYVLARSELAKATDDPVNAPRYAEAAATAQVYFEALLLSLQAP
jgi:predicted negative regulator of RcsB-dependent stress response